VQAAGSLDDLNAGAEHEVIRIAKDDLAADLRYFMRLDSLHGRLCADRHERRCFDGSPTGLQPSAPGARV
jgi:hypothetical protein